MTDLSRGPATYCDGIGAVVQDVTLVLEQSTIAIVSARNELLARWHYDAVESLPAVNDRLRLALADGQSTSRLEVREPAFADAVRQHLGLAVHQVSHMERARRSLIIRWSMAAVAALLVIAIVGLPALAGLLTPLIPQSWEMRVGAGVNAMQIKEFKGKGPFECGVQGPQERAGKAVFDRLFKRIETAAGLPVPIRAFAVRDPANNAIALPGGYVHIYMGFIADAQSPEEFAGVVAHEIGHVAHRHGLRKTLHTVGLAYLFGLALGDVFGSGAILIAAQQILSARHSRAQEMQADDFAVAVLNRMGIDSHRFSEFFERMMKRGGRDARRLLHSHPTDSDRIASIRSMRRPLNPRPLLTAVEWQALKQVCSGK